MSGCSWNERGEDAWTVTLSFPQSFHLAPAAATRSAKDKAQVAAGLDVLDAILANNEEADDEDEVRYHQS